jgi:tetratricopeptide (TPR) repeat protein
MLYKKMTEDPYEEARKRYKMTGEVETMLEQTFGPETYSRNDTLRSQILKHYRFSLERMAGIARSNGADVLFLTPPANIKDCSPFKSEHKEGLTVEKKRRFFYLMKKGQDLEKQQKPDLALNLYMEAQRIDDRYSGLYYHMGKVLFALGRFVEAKEAFKRARDEDICPLRALSVMRKVVLETAEKTNTPWIDFIALLEQRSLKKHGQSILGEEDFLDHVHLTVENHRLLSLAVIDKLIELGALDPDPEWGSTLIDSLSKEKNGKMDEKVHGVAMHNLAKVMNWAGKYEDAARIAARALDMLDDHPEALGSYLYVGTSMEREGKVNNALRYYRSAIAIDSNHAEAHYLLGSSLYRKKSYSEAEKHLLKALDLDPQNSELLKRLGRIWFKQGKNEKAVLYFSKGVKHWPDDPDINYYLGLALYYSKQKDKAAAQFQRVLKVNSDYAPAYIGMGNVLLDQGKNAEAINYYARALQIDPRMKEARRNLSSALQRMKR